MNKTKSFFENIEPEIVAVAASATARRSGTLVEELTARFAPTGLPPDVQIIVDVSVRAGMGEGDPNWIWLLPLLLRQVPAAALRIEFEALSGSLIKSTPVPGKASVRDDDNLEVILENIGTFRGELQKFPRRVAETLKPVVAEAVADALESAPGRVKVELDDAKLIAAARDAFMTLYVMVAIGFGAVSTLAAFIIGSKFG